MPIDEPSMIQKLLNNPTIQLFCTNDLRKDQKFSRRTFVLVSNFTFLMRIAAIHIVLVAIPFAPVT